MSLELIEETKEGEKAKAKASKSKSKGKGRLKDAAASSKEAGARKPHLGLKIKRVEPISISLMSDASLFASPPSARDSPMLSTPLPSEFTRKSLDLTIKSPVPTELLPKPKAKEVTFTLPKPMQPPLKLAPAPQMSAGIAFSEMKKVTTQPSFMARPSTSYHEEFRLEEDERQWALAQLDLRPDKLRDCSQDFRPVFSCVRPIVCHYTNTPFYAQCSTAKLGYCTWCRALRRGNQKTGSICMNCGERLTAKYHKWYPELVRLEPLEKERTTDTYHKYKAVFERFGVTWTNPEQLEFVVKHYMLLKIYVSHPKLNIEALHLERAYMIGVFAGREFSTGALARKLLKEGCKLVMFRADFPQYFEFLRPERAAVAENLNAMFFKGQCRCYLHSHIQNIEGWYDPQYISREELLRQFKALCNDVLKQTTKRHLPMIGGSNSMSLGYGPSAGGGGGGGRRHPPGGGHPYAERRAGPGQGHVGAAHGRGHDGGGYGLVERRVVHGRGSAIRPRSRAPVVPRPMHAHAHVAAAPPLSGALPTARTTSAPMTAAAPYSHIPVPGMAMTPPLMGAMAGGMPLATMPMPAMAAGLPPFSMPMPIPHTMGMGMGMGLPFHQPMAGFSSDPYLLDPTCVNPYAQQFPEPLYMGPTSASSTPYGSARLTAQVPNFGVPPMLHMALSDEFLVSGHTTAASSPAASISLAAAKARSTPGVGVGMAAAVAASIAAQTSALTATSSGSQPLSATGHGHTPIRPMAAALMAARTPPLTASTVSGSLLPRSLGHFGMGLQKPGSGATSPMPVFMPTGISSPPLTPGRVAAITALGLAPMSGMSLPY